MRNIIGAIAHKVVEFADRYRVSNYKRWIVGKDYRLGDKVYISHPKNISIGERTYINSGMLFASANAHINIGKDCLISYNVHIRTDMHNYMDAGKCINQQGTTEQDVTIEDDVWIGYSVSIMPGVCIRKGSVIGTGAVVTKSTDPYGVYVGIPARKIKSRGEEKSNEE